MNYREARAYIDELGNGGIMPGLDRIKSLLAHLGHPEEKAHVIHVAGTNGKGSVCAFIATALEEAGYRTGRYISPGIFDYCDRIQVNREWIGESDVAWIMTKIKRAIEEITAEGGDLPSAFEAETVMAFLYFMEQKCDFVVLECGMGGLEDATNVIEKPLLSVITSIGMDHMQYLGPDIASITRHKGGIIKTGRPVIIGAGDPEAVNILKKISEEKQALYTVTDFEKIRIREVSVTEGIKFDYGNYPELRTQMPALYQTRNAAIAIDALEQLKKLPDKDFELPYYLVPVQMITESVIYKGVSQVMRPGRFEYIEGSPSVIIDGAHNPHGAQALAEALNRLKTDKKKVLMMAVFKDKDYDRMLEILSDFSQTIVTYAPEGSRGLNAEILSEHAEKYFDHVIMGGSQKEAWKLASNEASADGLVLACGSLSTVAALKDLILSENNAREESYESN